jgi:hypothetical protein
MPTVLDRPEVESLVILAEEATRSSKEGVKRFIEPAQGTLRRAINKRHHIVFGRRGSGKSSLLRKAAADLTVDRRPIAYVDLETFKGHTYPDVLLSILLSALKEFNQWLKTAAIHPATRTTFWQKLFGSRPNRPAYNRVQIQSLSEDFTRHINNLQAQLHSSDHTQTTSSTRPSKRVLAALMQARTLQSMGSELLRSWQKLAAAKSPLKNSKVTPTQNSSFSINTFRRVKLIYEAT